MNAEQKTIIIVLVGVILLRFGSLTKVRSIWNLAFTPTPSTTQGSSVLPPGLKVQNA